MCFVLGFVKWSFNCVHRTLTFVLTAWLVVMIMYVCALAVVAGVAYGYEYCLAEYTILSGLFEIQEFFKAVCTGPNMQLEIKPREYGPDVLVRRTGNIVDLAAEGKENRVWPRREKVKSAKNRVPKRLFRAHRVNSTIDTSSKKKEPGVTDTAMNFRKADLHLIPFRYIKNPTHHRDPSNRARTTERANTDEEETAVDDKEAGLKQMPFMYAKWFSKPATSNIETVKMGEENEIYENKSSTFIPPTQDRRHVLFFQNMSYNLQKSGHKLLPLNGQRIFQFTNDQVSVEPTHTTKEAGIDEELSEEYQDGYKVTAKLNAITSTSASTVYIWTSLNPDITIISPTNTPINGDGIRWFIPKSTHRSWRPATSDTFFSRNKERQRESTKDSYNPEIKIRAFDRPDYGKSGELPEMRYWNTMTRIPESSTSDDNIDYKKFVYF